jgi:hypothetical protein
MLSASDRGIGLLAYRVREEILPAVGKMGAGYNRLLPAKEDLEQHIRSPELVLDECTHPMKR